MSKKTVDELRAKWVEGLIKIYKDAGEDVLRTKSNEICIPCVDGEGNDQYIVLTVKVPSGSRDGEAYDGYAEAQSYEMGQKEKAEKAKVAAEAKAKKIERDKAQREARKAAKEAHEAGKQ